PHCRHALPRARPLDVRVARAVGAHLLAVAAALHRAPRARLILRGVEEDPAAVLGAARLHARPGAFAHCGRDLGDDAPERSANSRRLRLEVQVAAGEADAELGTTGDALEDRVRLDDVAGNLVVRAEQGAQRLAQLDRLTELCGRRLRPRLDQTPASK